MVLDDGLNNMVLDNGLVPGELQIERSASNNWEQSA